MIFLSLQLQGVMFKETDSVNSVQPSVMSYALWVNPVHSQVHQDSYFVETKVRTKHFDTLCTCF